VGRNIQVVAQLSGGEHALTTLAERDGEEFVVRCFPAGDNAVEFELQVLPRLEGSGSWVPRLIAYSVDAEMPMIITTRVRGGHPSPGLSADVIAGQMAADLAKIHRIDGEGLREDPHEPPSGPGLAAVAARREWSRLNMSKRVLTHHDFWCGNALWDGAELTGVVDWSGARHAPRGVDLAWCRLDLVLLGRVDAADAFLAEYLRQSGADALDQGAWDRQAAAQTEDRVETWAPNYLGVGRPDLTPQLLRSRLQAWIATLLV